MKCATIVPYHSYQLPSELPQFLKIHHMFLLRYCFPLHGNQGGGIGKTNLDFYQKMAASVRHHKLHRFSGGSTYRACMCPSTIPTTARLSLEQRRHGLAHWMKPSDEALSSGCWTDVDTSIPRFRTNAIFRHGECAPISSRLR
jgi:hypothetical protein